MCVFLKKKKNSNKIDKESFQVTKSECGDGRKYIYEIIYGENQSKT